MHLVLDHEVRVAPKYWGLLGAPKRLGITIGHPCKNVCQAKKSHYYYGTRAIGAGVNLESGESSERLIKMTQV